LRLRRAPELTFVFDESIAHQDRIAQLLHELGEPPPDAPKKDDDTGQ
jgi:ribosome-binding factor A